LALLEGKLILFHLCKNFTILPYSETQQEISMTVHPTLRPAKPLTLKFIPRKKNE
jgi:hypothetical protein